MPTPQPKAIHPPLLVDIFIVATALCLVGFSLVMVYSTTGIVAQEKYGDAFFFVRRQGIAAIAGVILMFLASRLNIQQLQRISPYLFIASAFLLLLTILPGIGASAGGARRWIGVAGFRFQPGEFVKVMFVLFLAGFWARHENQLSSFTYGILKPFMLVGLVGGLLLLQPDFGSTAVLGLITMSMALACGVRPRYIFAVAAVFVACLGILVVVSPYRLSRIVSFLSPWSDAPGKGYQLIQSLIAVGTGQVAGVGLGESQQKLFFLPAAHTDFIFAVIGEELGFIGCVVTLMAFLIFLWRGLMLASKLTDNTFCFSLAVGLTMLIVLPALLNVGVVTGLLPTKGMVLPLIGYGGSSLVACLIAVGLLLALTRTLYTDARA